MRDDVSYKYKILIDKKMDIENWFNGCNSTSHGVDWKSKAPQDVIDNVFNKTKKSAFDFLIPFLNQKYILESEKIDRYKSFINSEYENKYQKACQCVVDLLGRPLFRNDFTVYLTTFPRGPYSYNDGYILICIRWIDPIKNFMHELLHFQFIHYWRMDPDSPVSKLSNEQFEYLKESLTVILDEDLIPLIESPDRGYEIHQNFRKELSEAWTINKDFQKLVEFGLEIIQDFVPNK